MSFLDAIAGSYKNFCFNLDWTMNDLWDDIWLHQQGCCNDGKNVIIYDKWLLIDFPGRSVKTLNRSKLSQLQWMRQNRARTDAFSKSDKMSALSSTQMSQNLTAFTAKRCGHFAVKILFFAAVVRFSGIDGHFMVSFCGAKFINLF